MWHESERSQFSAEEFGAASVAFASWVCQSVKPRNQLGCVFSWKNQFFLEIDIRALFFEAGAALST